MASLCSSIVWKSGESGEARKASKVGKLHRGWAGGWRALLLEHVQFWLLADGLPRNGPPRNGRFRGSQRDPDSRWTGPDFRSTSVVFQRLEAVQGRADGLATATRRSMRICCKGGVDSGRRRGGERENRRQSSSLERRSLRRVWRLCGTRKMAVSGKVERQRCVSRANTRFLLLVIRWFN